MTAALALVDQARADGLDIQINGDKLKLRGPAEVVEQWKPRIAASKPEIMAALSAPRSAWWLIHSLDGAPVETWTTPPATHADILERHPDAIAAEPIHQAAPNSATSCSTCANLTGRGSCGEPVAAGLSDLLGVIRYSADQGATCPAWLATIPDDLAQLIQRAGTIYEYSRDDFDLIRAAARRDPDGLRLALLSDPFAMAMRPA